MEDYNDFLTYLSERVSRLKELLEKLTTLHNEAAISLLEASTLYNPQILLDITEMMVSGRKFDKEVIEGHELKAEFEKLISRPRNTVSDHDSVMEELQLIKLSLSDNFDVKFDN